jgi:hypothetical protein
LENGQFLRVPTSLIKRCKQHFHSLRDHDGHALGVDVIIGTNGTFTLVNRVLCFTLIMFHCCMRIGYIWLTATPDPSAAPTTTATTETKDDGTSPPLPVSINHTDACGMLQYLIYCCL